MNPIKMKLPCGRKFLSVLNFAKFAIFSAIHKNKSPQLQITTNIFPAKIYSRVSLTNLNPLHKNTVLRKCVCSITTCLFHSETKLYTMNKTSNYYWFYLGYAYRSIV